MAQFPSRAAWAEHEFSNHRTTQSWTCPECAKDFLEVSTWEKHLQEMHRLFFSRSNLQVAKDMALKTEARRIEDDECPLCRIVVGKPRRGFVKHVGRHMEEIALMALPRDVEEDTEEGSTLPSDRQVPTQNTRRDAPHNGRLGVPHLEQPKSRFSLQKSAPANVSDNPIMVCANEDDANNGLTKKRKRKPRIVKPRKPRTLTDEGKAHAKMVREYPGGACADCKRRKNKARDPSVANMAFNTLITISSALISCPKIFSSSRVMMGGPYSQTIH